MKTTWLPASPGAELRATRKAALEGKEHQTSAEGTEKLTLRSMSKGAQHGMDTDSPKHGTDLSPCSLVKTLGQGRSLVAKATIGIFSEKTMTCAPSQGHKRHSGDRVRVWGPGLSQVSITHSQKALSNRSCL